MQTRRSVQKMKKILTQKIISRPMVLQPQSLQNKPADKEGNRDLKKENAEPRHQEGYLQKKFHLFFSTNVCGASCVPDTIVGIQNRVVKKKKSLPTWHLCSTLGDIGSKHIQHVNYTICQMIVCASRRIKQGRRVEHAGQGLQHQIG